MKIKTILLTCILELITLCIIAQSQQRAFPSRALDKAQLLGTYISTISNQDRTDQDRENSIALALELFVNPDQIVEVSSLNSDHIRRYTITQYLHRLRHLPYRRVEIQWVEVFSDSTKTLSRRPDGTYTGEVGVVQLFRGYSDSGSDYKDVTQKRIQYISRKIDFPEIREITSDRYEVLLGPIRVIETSPLK